MMILHFVKDMGFSIPDSELDLPLNWILLITIWIIYVFATADLQVLWCAAPFKQQYLVLT